MRAAWRETTWTLRRVSADLRVWRARAERIPDAAIREDALYALSNKRTHADGAALFSILPRRRDAHLLRLLVAYELILDFLDNVSERHRTEANGRELHLALVDAVDPTRTPADYYRHHPFKDDGGYLQALVETCQQQCLTLPSFEVVRRVTVREAWRSQVLALNHLTDPEARDGALARWAATECGGPTRDLSWFELTGAASASLVVLALLALASQPNITPPEATRIVDAYWPWMSLVAVMLDSYADQDEDAVSGDHSYVAHYPDHARIAVLAGRLGETARAVKGIAAGERHAVILAAMVAMYLSKDSARTSDLAGPTRELAKAGGSLTRALLPILRLWRTYYGHRAA